MACRATDGEAARRRASKRHQGGGDPTFLRPQHAPGARGGAAVHRFDADVHRFQFADERPGRLRQTRAGAEQQEFGPWLHLQHGAERRQRQPLDKRRVIPCPGAVRVEQQARRKDVIPDAETAPGKAGDDRPLPGFVPAQFDPAALAVQGLAPSSRGPIRSAWAARPDLLPLPSICGFNPRVMSSDEDT